MMSWNLSQIVICCMLVHGVLGLSIKSTMEIEDTGSDALVIQNADLQSQVKKLEQDLADLQRDESDGCDEPCLDGFIRVEGSTSCYKIVDSEKRTWKEANKACKAYGKNVNLVAAETEEEHSAIETLLNNAPIDALCTSGYTGLFTSALKISEFKHPTKDDPDYFGVWSSSGTQIGTYHWNTNEPHHTGSKGDVEDCVLFTFNKIPLTWFDAPCGTARCYMCEQMM